MLSRREFLISAGTVATNLTLGRQAFPSGSDIDEFIKGKMKASHIPGLAICVVKKGRIAQSKHFGWASIARKVVMSPDTLMNIASVSKTVTATAVMQLWEKDKFKLDEDINHHLPFRVKSPFHPDEAITFRHLMTHTSSIKDSAAYYRSYACGEPTMPLRTWLKEYLTPEGVHYQKDDNFYDSKPGERFSYSNIGFGLLGHLVETISGSSFSEFCKSNIFVPLDMNRTSWYIADLPLSKQAVPYAYVSNGSARGGLLQEYLSTKGNRNGEGYVPNCLYSFPNVSDGLVRTSVQQLAHFLIAFINNGIYEGRRILQNRNRAGNAERANCKVEAGGLDGNPGLGLVRKKAPWRRLGLGTRWC